MKNKAASMLCAGEGRIVSALLELLKKDFEGDASEARQNLIRELQESIKLVGPARWTSRMVWWDFAAHFWQYVRIININI